jgi:hypothetical protein
VTFKPFGGPDPLLMAAEETKSNPTQAIIPPIINLFIDITPFIDI